MPNRADTTVEPFRWLSIATGQGRETRLERRSFDPFPPPPGEVVIEVAGCGVCHTDIGFHVHGIPTRRSLPLTLGHEISGCVVAAGEGSESWLGRAVIVPAVIPCGACEACRAGRPTICSSQIMPGNDVHGGFASHVVVPARGLCPVDENRLAAAGLELWQVAVVADAVTTPYNALVEADVKPGGVVVVVGAGGIGGYAVRLALALGAVVVAVDVAAETLQRMADQGAHATFDSRQLSARELRRAVVGMGCGRLGWSIVECSGTVEGQRTAFGLLGPGATLVVVGYTAEAVTVPLSNLMAFHARAQGVWGCPPERYPEVLDMVLSRRVEVAPFVERHPLDTIATVFDAARHHRLGRRAVLVAGD